MDLSKILTNKRFNEGGIDFETPEVAFDLDEKGFPTRITRKERLDTHRLIEEFMLLANKTVARQIQRMGSDKENIPFIYRIHEKPDKEKLQVAKKGDSEHSGVTLTDQTKKYRKVS